MAALSIATDLGMGQPLESALRSCVVAMRLGEALNLDHQTLRDLYYQALLRYIGCNADTFAMAALFGDELALRHDFASVDPVRAPDVLGVATRYMRVALVVLVLLGVASVTYTAVTNTTFQLNSKPVCAW